MKTKKKLNGQLNQLSKECFIFVRKRMENGGDVSIEPWSLLKHMASEVSEVHEAFSWYENNTETAEPFILDNLENELADVIICCLVLTYACNLDIEEGLKRTIKKNKKRAHRKGDKL